MPKRHAGFIHSYAWHGTHQAYDTPLTDQTSQAGGDRDQAAAAAPAHGHVHGLDTGGDGMGPLLQFNYICNNIIIIIALPLSKNAGARQKGNGVTAAGDRVDLAAQRATSIRPCFPSTTTASSTAG